MPEGPASDGSPTLGEVGLMDLRLWLRRLRNRKLRSVLDLGFEALLVGGLGREIGERGEGRGSLKEGLEGGAEKRCFPCDMAEAPPERAASTAGGIGERWKLSLLSVFVFDLLLLG